ncbi:hypothetical protein M0R45_037426 [Rubus argutus]|uniref:Uncharacterized protein n=1 Tax=Rubus argutus TaxID=59490 RepID=A0AAW1W284_RUBAR
MAEALVNVLLERLANLAIDKVQKEFKLVTGVKTEVKNLTRNLKVIEAVLEDAEQRQVMDKRVRLWLDELNEVSYEMDDVLDEWTTEVLMKQMEKQENQVENALVADKKKVCFPFPASCCFCFGQVNQVSRRRDIAVRIKDLNERLALIEKEKQSFNFQNTTRGPELPERQKTTSLPGDKTFGRDKERSVILGKLLSEGSQEKGVPLIIPIVGMGGMGKTTLAQLVYNDQKVKTYFDKRIWVCVSDPFEDIKIAKAIVEGLDKNSPSRNSNELQTLLECIFELIEGKKFLLVLDDVWSPTLGQWEELIKPLRNGAMGSRILVTTRKEEVATLMKATAQIIHLKQLSEEFSLSLFYYHADFEISSDESKMFQDVGEKIVKKCDGLPLVAKTLGSLMRDKKTIKEWQDVLSSKIWELEEIETHVFRPLLLSYHDLASAIKRCLLYCVTFPKDYLFDREYLIELWMAQDYLNAKGYKEKNKNGQKYFENLVMRSFFQNIEVNQYGNTNCKMHDIVHDLLQYLTKNKCYTMDYGPGASDRMEEANDKVHHLTLLNVYGSVSLSYFHNCKKLRTLAALDSSISSIDPELIVQLKCLRTLNLRQLHRLYESGIEEIPKEIGRLIHLRYIDLSYNTRMAELPDTMSSLYNLQTLRLVDCRRLRILDLGRLINLRHLYVDGCVDLKLLRIERLKSLQRLDTFYVQAGDANNNEGNKLEDLNNLNQLQGRLTIVIMGHAQLTEKATLVNKAHLLHLNLVFQRGSVQSKLLNDLQPHPGLESLKIRGYRGSTLSTDWWSSLHSLRLLTLVFVYGEFRLLAPLGQLSSLESLHMGSFVKLGKVGVEFLGIDRSEAQTKSTFKSFPKLKQLSIHNMPLLEEWEGVDDPENNITIMPCLSSLTIYDCPMLKALPDFLWKTPLQTLCISESPILLDVYGEGVGEEWAKISHIPNIKLGQDFSHP